MATAFPRLIDPVKKIFDPFRSAMRLISPKIS